MCENPDKVDMVAAMAGKGQTRVDLREEQVKDLLKAWKKHPHLRLGQFIVNALGLKESGTLYYMSDEDLLEQLQSYPQDPIKKTIIIPNDG